MMNEITNYLSTLSLHELALVCVFVLIPIIGTVACLFGDALEIVITIIAWAIRIALVVAIFAGIGYGLFVWIF